MKPSVSILLVDDDWHLVQSMAEWLHELGHTVYVADCLEGAHASLQQHQIELVITDLRLGGEDGFQLISHVRETLPECTVLVMTGYATPDTAVEAIRAGAFDLLTKPLIDDELQLAIGRAVSHRDITRENQTLRRQLDRRSGLENILSHDYRMLKVFDMVDSVADARTSILITGENGTGKSMIARAIHERSSRRGKPFVEVACGALPDNLLESELFGHVKGAFTGASVDKVGKFQLADRGTLFLDEIGTASAAMQVKLLRVLQELQFEQVGGTKTHSVDTRVILATNEDLSKAVGNGTFRQDLYYRINVVNIVLPSLRQRVGDIPLLVEHFLREAAETCDRDIEGFDSAAMAKLQAYQWPGNVRQLQNVVERAVLLSRSPRLTAEDLPPEVLGLVADPMAASLSDSGAQPVPTRPHVVPSDLDGKSLREALEVPEREIILHSLRQNQWNRAATADALEINRTTLYKKMKRLGLDDPRLQFAGDL
ncbi:sigma-54-dependent Fis family transcriptional regulator [Roseiconus nitratireducens]|uniref:Sigma-54-dependent Fis family transcriptional regulator n=1 Tax=Roseiconus nitratireducens TaxID=2605748 RepID=A0A5M6DCT6_9BACT|nr:sigma-54 dependent transcriptional regulator [Roseiconus nitratireducens]KAA5544276.1 sigma-54-dependent Fis family transcriptional regulator [Roseiconus nitratireducens]